MRREKNHFQRGILVSLGLHLLLFLFVGLASGGPAKISSEPSIEVSLSDYRPRLDKKPKKPSVEAKKPDKKQVPKPVKKKAKPPEKKKAQVNKPPAKKPKPSEVPKAPPKIAEKPKESVKPKEDPNVEKTRAKEVEPEKKPSAEAPSEAEPLDDIAREEVLENMRKTAELRKKKNALLPLVLDIYYRKISFQIEKKLLVLPDVDSVAVLSANVSFYMREDGEVYDAKIETSSGNPRFDSYCIKAVNSSSPLPPPPAKLRERIKSEAFVVPCESKK